MSTLGKQQVCNLGFPLSLEQFENKFPYDKLFVSKIHKLGLAHLQAISCLFLKSFHYDQTRSRLFYNG